MVLSVYVVLLTELFLLALLGFHIINNKEEKPCTNTAGSGWQDANQKPIGSSPIEPKPKTSPNYGPKPNPKRIRFHHSYPVES